MIIRFAISMLMFSAAASYAQAQVDCSSLFASRTEARVGTWHSTKKVSAIAISEPMAESLRELVGPKEEFTLPVKIIGEGVLAEAWIETQLPAPVSKEVPQLSLSLSQTRLDLERNLLSLGADKFSDDLRLKLQIFVTADRSRLISEIEIAPIWVTEIGDLRSVGFGRYLTTPDVKYYLNVSYLMKRDGYDSWSIVAVVLSFERPRRGPPPSIGGVTKV